MSRRTRGVWWFRRPRRPLSGLLDDTRTWLCALVGLTMGVLFGIGVILDAHGWQERAGGALATAVSLALAIAFVGHLARPVHRGPWPRTPEQQTVVDGWAQTLAREGRVDIAVGKRQVAKVAAAAVFILGLGVTGVFAGVVWGGGLLPTGLGALLVLIFCYAALPLLETATAGGPVLQVDSRGIEIARRPRLRVPWSEITSVYSDWAGSRTTLRVYVQPSETFEERYLGSRPWLLRLADLESTSLYGGLTISPLLGADPELVADWLDDEAQQRGDAGPEAGSPR